MTLALLALALLLLPTLQLSLKQYSHLEETSPELLFSHQNLDYIENYPKLEKLVFTTPWNKQGNELTVKYAKKLDYVSPCWYSLQTNAKGEPQFQNVHNYDRSYVLAIKKSNPQIKLVPRVYVQGSMTSFFQSIGNNHLNFVAAVNLIHQLIKEKDLDGIVWDTPFNFFQAKRNSLNALICDFLIALRERIPEKLILFNMGNPMDHMSTLDIGSYERLPVDALLIQNYDKGGRFIQMIEKAIQWKNKLKLQAKLMLMLPFFSVSANNGQALSTADVAKYITEKGYGSCRMSQGTCLYSSKDRNRYYVPCWRYFRQAFSRAQAADASVGFWEGGNGLEKYYNFM